MDVLLKKGWILNETAQKTADLSVKKLLDRDLREVGAGVADLGKGKFESIEHERVVLQVLKIRNISAPKMNENSKTAPRLLKVHLTDGVNSLSAIEMEPTDLSIDTKPGTKIAVKVKQLKMANGQLLFTPKNIEIMGGEVEALVSKWEVTRSLAGMKGARTTTVGGGGPPGFTPFGQKIEQNMPADRGFKSLQPAKQKENDTDDSEFKAQRQDAIAEAAAKGTKKVFGGGSKQLVDGNVQKIIDKGYSEEQAVTALKYAHNNVDKALSNLKKREEHAKRVGSGEYEPREKRSFKGGRDRGERDGQVEGSAKPSGSVSLFSFLEDKIPTASESTSTAKESHYHHNERFENNISSSFRKHDKENSNKSQQWSSNGGGGGYNKTSQNKSYGSNYGSNPRGYRDDDSGPRGYRDDPRESERSSSYRDSRDSRNVRDGRGDTRDTRDSRDSKSSYHQQDRYQGKSNNSSSGHYQPRENQSNHYQKPSSAPSNHQSTSSSSYNSSSTNNNNNNNSKKYEKYDKYDKSYESKYDKSDKYEKYDKYQQKPDYNKQSSYHQQHQSSPPQQQQQQPGTGYNKSRSMNNSGKYYSNNDHHQGNNASRNNNSGSANVVDSMEKMSLRGNQATAPPPGMSNPPPNYPQPTQAPSMTTPNDPSKQKQPFVKPGSYPIVGFQNKEANEHAKNALKTKTIPGIPHPIQQQQQAPTNWQKQPHPVMQPMSHPQSQQSAQFAGQPPPPVVQPQSLPPQPFGQSAMIPHPMPAAVFSMQPNYPTQILVSSIPTPQPVSAQHTNALKIGDPCMAKYWEDGQFYSAKITNVTESTFVVLFTEYGNAEEVRKNDCLPLLAPCPTPPHTANFVPSQPAQAYHIAQQKMPQHHHGYQQPPQQASYNPNMMKNQRR